MSASSAARPTDRSSLRTRPDQPERWLIHHEPISFDSAARLVLDAHAEDGVSEDLRVRNLQTCRFGAIRSAMQLAPARLPGRDRAARLFLRELAFRQLCERIGSPPGYVRRLPAKLQLATMNWSLAQKRQSVLVRLAGNEVRAIVSNRYAIVDDGTLLDVVAQVLRSAGLAAGAMVRATSVGPSTIMRITLPNDGVAVRPGDIIEWGFDLGNSELGLRSVQVTPVTLRLLCTNGMRAWRCEAAMRIRHAGDPRCLRDQLRAAVAVALTEARGDVGTWKRAASLRIDSSVDEIESLRSLGLSGSDLRVLARQVAIEEGVHLDPAEELQVSLRMPTSIFAIANAMTAAARERGSVPARLALEELAHRYLTSRAA